ncbi:hypothetical protein ABZP36_012772 [Zizania latifolia]
MLRPVHPTRNRFENYLSGSGNKALLECEWTGTDKSSRPVGRWEQHQCSKAAEAEAMRAGAWQEKSGSEIVVGTLLAWRRLMVPGSTIVEEGASSRRRDGDRLGRAV